MTDKVKPDLFRPRWSKVLSDLWDSKFRTILVVASIAVGVFAIGVIASAYAILTVDIDLSYATVNPANIEIWTDPFDEDFIRMIKRVPGVEDVEGRRILGVRTSLDGVDWQSQGLVAVEELMYTKRTFFSRQCSMSFSVAITFVWYTSSWFSSPTEMTLAQ